MQHIVFKNNLNKFDQDINLIYNDLAKNGFSIFNVGKIYKEQFLEFCYNLGEVIPSGRNKSLVDEIFINDKTGTQKLPFHTDKSYWRIPPRYEILYVDDVVDMKYGEITISSIIKAFESLNKNEQEKLLNISSQYNSPNNRDSGYNPSAPFINTIDGKIEYFRYRLDIFNSNIPEINKLSEFINNNYYKIAYKKGDILILDNWKFAAGRNITEWGPGGLRRLFRTLVI